MEIILPFLNFLFEALAFIPKRLLMIYLFLCTIGIAYTVGWVARDVRRTNLKPLFYLGVLWKALKTGEFGC